MTSRNTFEQSYHRRLLDLIYGQWASLGGTVVSHPHAEEFSVIDPEALLWCSLEFLPTEPRLEEIVAQWLVAYPAYLIRQRIIKAAKNEDPRALLWQCLDQRDQKPERVLDIPAEPVHGLGLPEDVVKFAQRIKQRNLQNRGEPTRLGHFRKNSATLLLQARDLLGHDIRHFLLVYLLANPHGAKLKNLQRWSRHAYRSLSDAADRWKAADVISLESGYCRLIAAEPFQTLLRVRDRKISVVNWWTVFETSVRLLRDLAKSRTKGFETESAITTSLKREALKKLNVADLGSGARESLPVRRLLECFDVYDALVR